MKDILFRLLLAAAVTLAALTLWSPPHGQQADEVSTPTHSRPQGENLQSFAHSGKSSPSTSASPSDQAQNELVFNGLTEEKKGSLGLRTRTRSSLAYSTIKQDSESSSANW